VVHPILELLHCVDEGSVANILEAQAVSIFRVELCRVDEFLCTFRIVSILAQVRYQSSLSQLPPPHCFLKQGLKCTQKLTHPT
jgi:hypothetical protein